MSKPYWMDLVIEFIRPGHSELSARPIPPLDGVLRPNTGLHDVFESTLAVPEPWDVLVADDGVYVASGKEVLRADSPDGPAIPVASFSGVVSCLGIGSNGHILVGVGGYGLVSLGPDGSSTDLITTVDAVPIQCPTAVSTGPGGEIYLTDGSLRHEPQDWVWDLMERSASGRLIRYDPHSGDTRVLRERLAYPAGVVVTHDGEGLLFTTAWDHSLRRFTFDSGRTTTVQQGLPGYPGKLSAGDPDGYWLAMFAMRTHLVEFVLTEDNYRAEMMRTINPDYWIRPSLKDLNNGLEPLQGGGIKKLGIKKPWAPPRSYGMAIRLGDDGDPVASFQSRSDQDRHGVLSVRQREGVVFVACYGADAVLVGREVV